jgi:hypothetical protein
LVALPASRRRAADGNRKPQSASPFRSPLPKPARPARPNLVACAACGADAIYVFACDHPDAHNAAINIMVEQNPAGERIRRPGIHNASRH